MKKTIRAWAVLNKNGDITAGPSLDIHLTKDRAYAMIVMRDSGKRVVRCTITYEFPKETAPQGE